MPTQSFYHNGLKFQCQPGCAACCKLSGHVRVTVEDVASMSALLGLPGEQFISRFVNKNASRWVLKERDDGACVMLDEHDRCRVYAARPQQCRSYPFWPEILANEFTWLLEKATCPGLDVGEHFSRERIVRIMEGADAAGGYPSETRPVEGE